VALNLLRDHESAHYIPENKKKHFSIDVK
jgi:hypothetical protein